VCSFYLDLYTPALVRNRSCQVPYSHGVRFELEVPFVNPSSPTSTAHVVQLGADLLGEAGARFVRSLVLRQGAREHAARRFLCSSSSNSLVVREPGTCPENWKEGEKPRSATKADSRLWA
jgi:hypothetical protein